MSLRETVATGTLTAGASMATVTLVLVTFLSLPESLLYNDYVSAAILAGAILLVAGVVRLAHPDGDVTPPRRSDR